MILLLLMTGILNFFKVSSSPIPLFNNKCGVFNVPADKITSFFT